jgi:hypothetical protein
LVEGGAIETTINKFGQGVEVVLRGEREGFVKGVHEDGVRVGPGARLEKVEATLQPLYFLLGPDDVGQRTHEHITRDRRSMVGVTFFSVCRAET